MNGRVYEPTLGRFLSPDPVVQFPRSTQGLNRYTYTNNNPLSFTDPSGFFSIGKIFSAIGDFFGNVVERAAKVVKTALRNQVVQIAGSIIIGAELGPYGAAAFSGFTTLANGGDLGDALFSAWQTLVFIRVTAAIGNVFGHNAGFLSDNHFGKIIAHGIAGGIRAELNHGKFQAGFLAGSATAFGAPLVTEIGGAGADDVIGRTAVSAVIGGASAKLGGGKFVNGALTGAFQRLYNDEALRQKYTIRLFEHEGIGTKGGSPGHTILRHVGVKHSTLVRWILEDGKKTISTFVSLADAEAIANGIINDPKALASIDAFLRDPDSERLGVLASFLTPTGVSLTTVLGQPIVEKTPFYVQVVIRKPLFPGATRYGFVIETMFPEFRGKPTVGPLSLP